MTPPARPREGFVAAAFLMALLVGVLTLDALRGRLSARVDKVRETSDIYPLPSPEYVHRAALGYDGAVASILWASTLYQYGVHIGQNRRFGYATEYVRTILHLENDFTPAYKFVSTFVTMQPVNPEPRELEEVRRILANGTVERPNDPDVWGAYASFLMFEGSQFLPQPTKGEWKKVGALAAQRAAELGYFSDLAVSGAYYLEKAGYRELAIQQLERSFAVAPNDEARDEIRQKLERMQANATIERLNRGFAQFIQKWSTEGTLVPEGTFEMLGPRRDTWSCVGLAGKDPRCDLGWRALTP
jgi:hypothetical protein